MSEQTLSSIGADVGGTFTDITLVCADGVHIGKVLSTPPDYAHGISRGVAEVLTRIGGKPEQVASLVHGTTVATNAVLQRRGAATALITTEGFRDVLELGRGRRPTLYDLQWQKPASLVERQLRFTIKERIGADGAVLAPLNPAEVDDVIAAVLASGVESVAVAFLHAYVNPDHEVFVGERIRAARPDLHVSLSSAVQPQIKEYERTSTTVVNAYVAPILSRYLGSLEKQLRAMNLRAPVLLMQSNGGVIPAAAALQRPVTLIESGPAAGAIAAAAMARESGHRNLVAFDMGGTTAKACLVEEGRPRECQEFEVGVGINVESHLCRGGGYVIGVPSIDLAEVGAGGGSLARVDRAGGLQVGPESAGANPGPACYGLGGTHPTVTDACVALGYMSDVAIAGGSQAIDPEKARAASQEHVAGPLGLSVEQAAYAIYMTTTATMMRAIRAVTTERGRDPRGFAMLAFGGAGPLFGAELARQLAIPRVLVPRVPGVFSSLGLLLADLRFDLVRSVQRPLANLSGDTLEAAYRELEAEARARYAGLHLSPDGLVAERAAELRYADQSGHLHVAVAGSQGNLVEALRQAFEQEHERAYGHRGIGERIVLANLRLRALHHQGEVGYARLSRLLADQSRPGGGATERRAYFGPERGWLRVPVLARPALSHVWQPGPLLIDEYDATLLVPPGCQARLDDLGSVVIEPLTMERTSP